MKYTQIAKNFIYPQIKEQDYKFGSGQLAGEVLRPDGDWRDYLPPTEDQRRNGIESSSCYIQATQHALATLQEEQFNIKDSNYSERFNFILSGGTEQGGDPLKGAQSIRDDGVIPDALLPFSDLITSWQEFASFKDGEETYCKKIGEEFRQNWDFGYDIVFWRELKVETKYKLLKEALKYSPIPMSVYGWVEENGFVVKTDELVDNHLTLCVYIDDANRPYFFDTYEPFIKIGQPFYNSDFAMRLSVKKKIISHTKWERFWAWLVQQRLLLRYFIRTLNK